MRPRDALGRIVAAGSPLQVPEVPEQALPPDLALAQARQLLSQGRAFGAHEVCEAVWKHCPAGDRELWQGLAQVCVGVTHYQRGNTVGAQRLLLRGAGRLRAAGPAADGLLVSALAVAGRAEAAAALIAAGRLLELADLQLL